ncbi:MAG: tetratricopeptide repeat protein [Candidatus Goldbacteria bacterium]|nr:tetratricopeptide repeat protein [Candidatus Goldiibacteriota bacterium]
MWYHLNGGRYILEHGTVPKDSSFFSFIEPPREWVDYYWLFQVLVYKIYSFSGYYGLVFLRAIMFLSTIIVCYLIINNRKWSKPDLYTAIIITLCVLFILPRFSLVRPHIFTYFFIVFLIFLIEAKNKSIFIVPIVATFWVNLHGIAYPILLLIIMAYLIDFFFLHLFNKQHIKKEELVYLIPLILSLMAVYFTPHGMELLSVPFIPTEFAAHYIQEIRKITLDELTSFQIIKLIPMHPTVFNFFLIASFFSLIVLVIKRDVNISSVIMFIGAIFLLFKSGRFRYEFILLSLPFLSFHRTPFDVKSIQNKAIKSFCIIVVLIFMFIPFKNVYEMYQNKPKYPFSERNLPAGVAKFLNYIDVEGKVLNHPNYGGYLQWMLYPKYKIFMDMEVPFLFTNEDMLIATKMFNNKDYFQNIIVKYDPSFVIASYANRDFKNIIETFPVYKPVFFDDSEVLYINEKHYPAIAKQYKLTAIEPFAFTRQSKESLGKSENTREIFNEILRIKQISPDSGIINRTIAIMYSNEGKFELALEYAKNIVINYPESPTGYIMLGDCYKGLKQYKKAIESYRKALNITDNQEIRREIGLLYLEQKDYKKAYETLIKIMNIYSPNVTYKELHDLILSAILSENTRDAEILLRYAIVGIPETDLEWIKKYNNLQELLKEKSKK